MGMRQQKWARLQRDKLRIELGGVCRKCKTTIDLEFDLIIPLGNNDHHRKMEWSWRMSFYRKQHSQGNLQLLCAKHNGGKKDVMSLWAHPPIDEPF